MSLLSKTVRRVWPGKPRPVPQPAGQTIPAVRETDVRGQTLYFRCADETAQYEPQVLDYIDRLQQGACFYDLGACVGFFSLYAAACGLKAYSFEIEAKNFAALEANLAVNPRLAVEALHVGVSDGTTDWADLRVGQDRAGGHHKTLVSDEFAGPANIVDAGYAIERVRVVGLDQLIAQHRLPPPEHMKIDIDGSEVLFLRGAARTLANPALQSLMFELYEGSHYYGEIVQYLSQAGFALTAKHPIEQPWPGCEQLFNCEFWRTAIASQR